MKTFTKTLFICSIATVMVGCKIAVLTSSGGDVQSSSGTMNCAGSSFCEFEVSGAPFAESFTAHPKAGYEFEKWSDGESFFCGKSTDPTCTVNIPEGAAGAVIVALFQSGYVMPIFKHVGIDTDGDGVRNELDEDDDNDGIFDVDDACPLDPSPGCTDVDYLDLSIYPISDVVSFRSHSTGDVFKLSDGSAWRITGTSNSGYNTGRTTSNVTIYNSTLNTPDPMAGIRSEFYIVGNGINPAFFINPLMMTEKIAGTVSFRSHSTGDVFKLSDGSAWRITGTSNSGYNTGRTTSNVTIYNSTLNTPDPMAGIRSEFYLVGNGINPAFFVTPI